jgi:ATP-dependent DNA ligase
VPIGPGWIHELKHDGFRIVAHKDGDVVRLWSRNGRDWSAEFAAITAAVVALPVTTIVLDGEAVAHCPAFRTSTRSCDALGPLQRASTPSTSCTSLPTICGPWRPLTARALLRKQLRMAVPALQTRP